MTAHPLVTAEWPHITDLPAYDFQIATDDVHLGVYVRRVSGDEWHVLAGLVNHVVVAPGKRGEGRGAAAVKVALTWLAAIEVSYALLHCEPAGAGFYEELGFRPASNFPAPAHRGERVSMVREITGLLWPSSPVTFVEPW